MSNRRQNRYRMGWMVLILLLALIDRSVGYGEECNYNDPTELQDETHEVITYLSSKLYIKNNDRFHTLFSDQSPPNIAKYEKHFQAAQILLKKLKHLKNCWEQRKNQNTKDKISLAYLAYVHLAMYSIHSRFSEFIYYKKLSPDTQDSYNDYINEWKEKAEDDLTRARKYIKGALAVDSYYTDARILDAELLAFSGEYDAALARFKEIQLEGWFDNAKSFYYSWTAYIELKSKSTDVARDLAKDYLSKSKAFDEPQTNAKWSKEVLKTNKLIKTKKATATFVELKIEGKMIEPQQLLSDMGAAINSLRAIITDYMNITINDKTDAVAQFEKNPHILFDLSTDHSDENLKKYARLLKSVHTACQPIVANFDIFQKYIVLNIDDGSFYLLNKSAFIKSFLEVVQFTLDFSQNSYVTAYLEQELEEGNGDKTHWWLDFQKWWEAYSFEIVHNINKLNQEDPDFLPTQMLKFEYQAVFERPETALATLVKIESKIKKRSMMTIGEKGGQSLTSANGHSYLNCWKAFLAQKQGNYAESKKLLSDASYYSGMENWKREQEKRLDIIEKLNKPTPN